MEATPEQIRAARALLRLEQTKLARQAHLSVVTLRRLEAARGRERVAQVTRTGVHRALEAAGAKFIPGGVRRRPSPPPAAAASFNALLRAISVRSAARLQGSDRLTDADLYDGNGLPA